MGALPLVCKVSEAWATSAVMYVAASGIYLFIYLPSYVHLCVYPPQNPSAHLSTPMLVRTISNAIPQNRAKLQTT